jgi:hypothetical protein
VKIASEELSAGRETSYSFRYNSRKFDSKIRCAYVLKTLYLHTSIIQHILKIIPVSPYMQLLFFCVPPMGQASCITHLLDNAANHKTVSNISKITVNLFQLNSSFTHHVTYSTLVFVYSVKLS